MPREEVVRWGLQEGKEGYMCRLRVIIIIIFFFGHHFYFPAQLNS